MEKQQTSLLQSILKKILWTLKAILILFLGFIAVTMTAVNVIGYDQVLNFVSNVTNTSTATLQGGDTTQQQNVQHDYAVEDVVFNPAVFQTFFIASVITAIFGTLILSKKRSILEALLLFNAFALPKERKSWGKVFDHVNSRGVAFASIRIFNNAEEKMLITQTVADLDGRYKLHTEHTTFQLEVKASGYEDHTRLISSTTEIYEITEDIPLKKLDYEKLNPLKSFYYSIRPNLIRGLVGYIYVWAIIYFIFNVYQFVLYPAPTNFLFVIFGIYAVPWNTYVLLHRARVKRGTVVEGQTKKPIAGVQVQVFDNERQVLSIITDETGIPTFDINPGTYKMLFSKPGFALEGSDKFITAKITKDGYLDKNINMKKVSESASENLENPFA